MCRLSLVCMVFLLVVLPGALVLYAAGNDIHQSRTVMAKVTDGDTLIVMELAPVSVVAPREFDSRRAAWRHNRLVRNVKIAYPYAQLAGAMFREYTAKLQELETERERRAFTEQAEQELLDRFEDDLRKLTFSQGLILIKLVDRETQHTSYDIVREFRGVFRAFFWQSIGRLFGFDLKTEYDPYGDDRDIEEIVTLIEEGLIQVIIYPGPG